MRLLTASLIAAAVFVFASARAFAATSKPSTPQNAWQTEFQKGLELAPIFKQEAENIIKLYPPDRYVIASLGTSQAATEIFIDDLLGAEKSRTYLVRFPFGKIREAHREFSNEEFWNMLIEDIDRLSGGLKDRKIVVLRRLLGGYSMEDLNESLKWAKKKSNLPPIRAHFLIPGRDRYIPDRLKKLTAFESIVLDVSLPSDGPAWQTLYGARRPFLAFEPIDTTSYFQNRSNEATIPFTPSADVFETERIALIEAAKVGSAKTCRETLNAEAEAKGY